MFTSVQTAWRTFIYSVVYSDIVILLATGDKKVNKAVVMCTICFVLF